MLGTGYHSNRDHKLNSTTYGAGISFFKYGASTDLPAAQSGCMAAKHRSPWSERYIEPTLS